MHQGCKCALPGAGMRALSLFLSPPLKSTAFGLASDTSGFLETNLLMFFVIYIRSINGKRLVDFKKQKE